MAISEHVQATSCCADAFVGKVQSLPLQLCMNLYRNREEHSKMSCLEGIPYFLEMSRLESTMALPGPTFPVQPTIHSKAFISVHLDRKLHHDTTWIREPKQTCVRLLFPMAIYCRKLPVA
jgi:hypothetical protein